MTTISLARIYRPDGTSSKLSLPSSGGSNDVVRLLAGPVSDDVVRIVPSAVRLARRIVPWATLVMSPQVLQIRDPIPGFQTIWIEGLTCIAVGGTAHRSAETIYLSMAWSPSHVLEMVCHEAWHLIESRLSDEWRERIDAELITPLWTNDDAYWSDPEECRARAFQAWCRRLIEGMPGPLFVRGSGGIDEIFSDCWDGLLGQALMTEERMAA